MKKQWTFVLTVVLCLCSIVAYSQRTETRKLPPFDQVHIGGSFDVLLTQGDNESVKIESERLEMETILTEVERGVLKIRLKDGNYRNTGTIKMQVTYKDLKSLSNSGSSSVLCNSSVSTDHFVLKNSGSGKIKLNSVTANSIDISSSGSGSLEIAGKTREQSLNISGSGKINAGQLNSETSHVRLSGSGDADIAVSKTLEAQISGSGDVRYRGSPEVRNVRVSGSGSVRKAD